ncbi:Fe-S-containing hydro-lyase [Sporomusa malonica]|uniref:Fumarate hydratase subunit beta n=1 Tax=Sporomusa malonica TaxID=112901 RepID=A0A1W2DT08_9FIRM|nr:Fe-S-containing hydro-lyase [Sporomusa malonica]SMD00665.1 fumarate hydratase subunit beta [Sporomusa malonica]
MEETIKIVTPLTKDKARELKAGDFVLITGTIYTARDAAHKRMVEALDAGEKLPVDLTDQIIYYVGPAPAKPGKAIGSAGPTTSGRMDAYAPRILDQGLRGMIGKGYRSPEVVEAMKQHSAVYFAATGGAAALIAKSIKKYELVAYEDLGPEALARLTVEDFPAIVVIDSEGRNFYTEGQAKYRDL